MSGVEQVPAFMEAPITLLGIALIILAICGFINIVATTITWVAKVVEKVQQPEKDRNSSVDLRFTQVESRIDSMMDIINNIVIKYDDLVKHYHSTAIAHDNAIASLIEGQKLLLEVEVASIDYKLNDGADKTRLMEMDEKLTEYLTNAAYHSNVNINEGWDGMETLKQQLK